MEEYIKLFENHADYEQYINSETAVLPNVSYCINENKVHYKPFSYANVYLTTVALENGTISFNIWKSMDTDMITSISYSTDNGETWTTTNNEDDKEEHLTISVNVSEGDKVLWKGNAQQLGYNDEDKEDYVGSFFSSSCEFSIQGNVMSILYGDDFVGEETLEYDGELACLFYDYGGDYECLVVSAEHMVLPATTLAQGCYNYMFQNCKSLVSAPELPATTLASNCYQSMFSRCTSLVTAPELPATTLANSCYNHMFYNCTSLETAPELPVTTLEIDCYSGMFFGCTSLVTAPELPATTLANICYAHMFLGCTSLKTAPELPATTLADYCYYSMFSGCTNLSSITCLATDISATDCTSDWVSGVAASGTFKKAASVTWARGNDSIPSGWTVEDY